MRTLFLLLLALTCGACETPPSEHFPAGVLPDGGGYVLKHYSDDAGGADGGGVDR